MPKSVLLLIYFLTRVVQMKITNLLNVNGNLLKLNAFIDELRQGQKDLLHLLSQILTTLKEIRDLLDLGMGDSEIRSVEKF
jgi:hypothetical protein